MEGLGEVLAYLLLVFVYEMKFNNLEWVCTGGDDLLSTDSGTDRPCVDGSAALI